MAGVNRHKVPAMVAQRNLLGQIECPGCGVRFKMSDRRSWTGYRHKPCHQQLIISNVAKQAEPVWCVVANISEHIPFGPRGDEIRRGTKHFSAGTKVYCYPPLWGDGYENVKVIGHHRGSRQYAEMIVPARSLSNCRAKLVYTPFLLDHLSGHWDETKESKKRAEELADLVNSRNHPA